MTSHDKVVERLARHRCGWSAIGESEWKRFADDVRKDLALLCSGDELGKGLWAAPEEPTEAMLRAGVRDPDWIKHPRIAAEVTKVYKAMRHAAGDNDG